MFKVLSSLTLLLLAVPAMAEEKPAKGEKVEYQVYTAPYFEKNTSGLKGDVSYLVLPDKKGFDEAFGIGVVMGKKPDLISEGAFEKKLVIAVINGGDAPITYKVDGVTAADGALQISYTATAGKKSDTARFASPLIITVSNGDYKTVNFIENGKEAGSAKVAK